MDKVISLTEVRERKKKDNTDGLTARQRVVSRLTGGTSINEDEILTHTFRVTSDSLHGFDYAKGSITLPKKFLDIVRQHDNVNIIVLYRDTETEIARIETKIEKIEEVNGFCQVTLSESDRYKENKNKEDV